MKDSLLHMIKAFLSKYHDGKRPILLGLSGGPDSLALFYLLSSSCADLNIQLAIAHIDHGWREESEQEAQQLKKLSCEHRAVFHGKKISLPEKNLEASCRNERIRFFKNLCQSFDYQAVLLAHHRDDQAETVLKSILEGAHLAGCSGMSEAVVIDGLTIWRPLLNVSKNTLIQWLEKRQIQPFFDRTNQDTKFLRARLRTQVIPALSRFFGKKTARPLCQIGKEAQELQQYLEEKIAPFLRNAEMSSAGSFLDLSISCPENLIEAKFLIRRLCQNHQGVPSRGMIEEAASHLLARSANRKFALGRGFVYVDRRRIFIPYAEFPKIPETRVPIQETRQYGPWLVATEKGEVENTRNFPGWQEVWKGRVEIILPFGKDVYQIGPPQPDCPFPRTSPLRKWWNRYSVPAFLRPAAPVIWSGDRIVYELLSGKNMLTFPAKGCCLKVMLTRWE